MHESWFRKGKSFPNKTTETLSEGTIPSLNMCCFACFLAYLCELIFWYDKLICPAPKSVKQCPFRYSSGMLFHNSRQVFSLRSPIARAITCRVWRQRAIHIHILFDFLKTNEYNSSNSIIIESVSFGSGVTNVSFKGGSLAPFFSANLWLYCVLLQMFLWALSNYSALDRIW